MKLLLPLALTFSTLFGHQGHHHPAATEMSNAAKTFLASLEEAQKKEAQFEFKSDERENWHFIPMVRQGIRFGEMKAHQQHLAFGLLGTGLSQKGLLTATQIMTLEQVLADRGGDPEIRNTEKYYIAIFGTPSHEKPWGWRFEGHHLSLNFTIIGKRITAFPSFYGTNPAELKKGPLKGMRPLGEIEDAARALALKLKRSGNSPVFTEKPPEEILTHQDRTAKAPQTQGITSKKLTGSEVEALLSLIDLVASFQRKDISTETLRKIHSLQRKHLHFAWGGSLEREKGHYFRIQGKDFLIEYANTQNNANHAHLVWRDLNNDFGRDLLKKHFKLAH